MKNDVTVLFIWQLREELKDYLKKGLSDNKNIRLVFPTDAEQKTLLKHALQARVIVGWRPTRDLIEAAEDLELFINPGAGVQHLIELFQQATRERRIILVNGHSNTYFAAQHAVALLLALMNKVIPHHNWMAAGVWRRGDDNAISIPLRDQTIGLLGYGAVNQKVHQFLQPYKVRFAILKRNWQRDRGLIPDFVKRFDPDDLEGFFKYIDIAIIAVPLTSATRGLISTPMLNALGRNGILVNLARGEVVCEKDLFKALKNRSINGAALDVWYEYRPAPDSQGRAYPYHYPFHTLDNVVLSPHRAASPFNDLKRWDEVIENIKRFAQGRRDFMNIVDLAEEY